MQRCVRFDHAAARSAVVEFRRRAALIEASIASMAADVGLLADWRGSARDEFDTRRRRCVVDARELASALRHAAMQIERAAGRARLAEAELASVTAAF